MPPASMKFHFVSLLYIAVYATEQLARSTSNDPCYPDRGCTTMACCRELYPKCRPVLDCSGEVVYIRYNWPNNR